MNESKKVQRIKDIYKPGMEIELISMEDIQAVPPGTKGIIDFVDDMGTIQMTWETGSSLGLVVGEDKFKIINKELEDDDYGL